MEDREDNSPLRAQPQTAELPHQASPSATHVLPKLYVGTMNDGLFIITRPPRPAPRDVIDGGDPETEVIATMAGNDRIAQARAAFIVSACNAHDDLVAALKVAREHVRFFCEETDDEGTEDCKRDLAQIDAALAKAGHAPEPRGEADPSNPRP